MSLFACAIQASGDPVPRSFREGVDGSSLWRDRTLAWYAALGFVGAVVTDSGSPASIARLGPVIAIGDVRLDNRADVARMLCCADEGGSDLALALRFVTRDHGARIGQLLGDFAFVVWDPTCRSLLAARDTFGVRKLFHAAAPSGLLTFSSRASIIAWDGRFDTEYIADRIAHRSGDQARTVYAGVHALLPASVLRVRNGASATTTYWSAAEAQADTKRFATPGEQVEAFRTLLLDSVRLRIQSRAPVWSQLSGGLDSSSVVSSAEWMAARGAIPCGLAGTVTYTDDLGTGADEREFSDAVVRHYGLPNELVPHRPDSRELMRDPPMLDQPDLPYAIAIRDRAAARIVAGAGGRAILTGEGGDALVAGTMFFFADWLVSGRILDAVREMAHRSALGRVSFWRLAYENALLPLLPAPLRRTLTRMRAGSTPPWIREDVRRHIGPFSRSMHDQVYAGRRGQKYPDALALTIASIPLAMPVGPMDDILERRHPFLHRPLVELALRLPPEMCVQPHARKWILREAMRGIVPDLVRTRVGKGALDGLNAWSLVHERQRLDRLLRDPILAQLQCIEPGTLRRTLDDARNGRGDQSGWQDRINDTLEVEMWLQLRSGRWAATDTQDTSTRNNEVAC